MSIFSRRSDAALAPVSDPAPSSFEKPFSQELFGRRLDPVVKRELEGLILNHVSPEGENSRFRGTFLGLIEGRTPAELAEEVGSSSDVTVYRRALCMAFKDEGLDGRLSDSIAHMKSEVDLWLAAEMSDETREHLTSLSQEAVRFEVAERERRETKAEMEAKGDSALPIGIYVHSYPSLILAAENASRPPLVKIGAVTVLNDLNHKQLSKNDRFEKPVMLAEWNCDEPKIREEKIHRVLKAAGMHSYTDGEGSEWFRAPVELFEVLKDLL